jgi:hypothetical protein
VARRRQPVSRFAPFLCGSDTVGQATIEWTFDYTALSEI